MPLLYLLPLLPLLSLLPFLSLLLFLLFLLLPFLLLLSFEPFPVGDGRGEGIVVGTESNEGEALGKVLGDTEGANSVSDGVKLGATDEGTVGAVLGGADLQFTRQTEGQ